MSSLAYLLHKLRTCLSPSTRQTKYHEERSSGNTDDLLCLKCRGIGHKVSSCPQPGFQTDSSDGNEFDWFQSPLRNQVRAKLDDCVRRTTLCLRCECLDLLSWLDTTPTVEDTEELSQLCKRRYQGLISEEEERRTFRKLSTVETLELPQKCGLCRCLFDMIPNPHSASQTVMLALSWTLFRMEHHSAIDNKEKRTTSRFVTAILDPPAPGMEVHRTMTVEGDGLVIARPGTSSQETTLMASPVKPSAINTDQILSWLQICTDQHQFNCSRPSLPALDSIRLIDAETRAIVPYSPETCEYLTLSYVWGCVDQQHFGAGSLGSRLPVLPQTLEDAIDFTLQLGKRYIWIDSVCIDQTNPEDKAIQIAKLSDIYRNSFANIVALDGEDANAGLPRVSATRSSPQLSCEVQGTTLRTIGPTLERLISASKWNIRAWTYQEALLSPRNLFFSRYGVYFECNSMVCQESLDTSNSPVHNAAKNTKPSQKQSYNQTLNVGMLRNPVTKPVIDRGRGLNIYSLLSSLYNRRQMTDPADALVAFSALLQAIQENIYPTGFFWGLPLADLNWALVWQAFYPHEQRNLNFPSWSWLSNRYGFWPGGPSVGRDGVAPDACPFDLELSVYDSTFCTGRKTVFEQRYRDLPQEYRDILTDDPLSDPSQFELEGDFALPPNQPLGKLLFFESPVFEFAIHARWEEEGNGFHSLFSVRIGDEELRGITTYDPSSDWSFRGKQLWLLLTRHVEGSNVLFNFLLLRWKGGAWGREDMARLKIPVGKTGLLRGLGIRKMRGVLV